MHQKTSVRLTAGILLLLFMACTRTALGELYINEIYFDPPKDFGDVNQEFVELRGTAGMSLNNHYLLLLENENNAADSGNPGQVDFIFDLNGRSLSPTGFFSLRQRSSPYTGVTTDAYNVINTQSGLINGWGSTPGVDNNIGVSNTEPYSSDPGRIENSGFTAMLIRVNPGGLAPALGMHLDGDVDNDDNVDTEHDGLDYPNGVPNLGGGAHAWDILDSIGIFSEGTNTANNPNKPGEAIYGRTYAAINFGYEIPGQSYSFDDNGAPTTVVFQPNIGPGQTYLGLGYEVEMAARWGNSTGQTTGDWHITNLSDDAGSGYQTASFNFRQSTSLSHPAENGVSNPPPQPAEVDTNQGVPYGTILSNTIGKPNFILGDFSKDGYVETSDYLIWRMTQGATGSDVSDLPADPNHDYIVNSADYSIWAARYGTPNGGSAIPTAVGATSGVPEPSSVFLALIAAAAAGASRRRPKLPAFQAAKSG